MRTDFHVTILFHIILFRDFVVSCSNKILKKIHTPREYLPPCYGLRLHETGSVWNRYDIGTNKPCVYTEPSRSTLGRFSYPVPNGFNCESDPVSNFSVPGWYRARVNPTQVRIAVLEQMEPNCPHLV